MQLLTNYAACFDGQFKPYSEKGTLKVLCEKCGKEVEIDRSNNDKIFHCECSKDNEDFSCSLAFYSEMESAAAEVVSL